jgi:hypothetical protein
VQPDAKVQAKEEDASSPAGASAPADGVAQK